ncbi:MAG: PKD domain-containing protein, partial [Bacteroidota bacterium]
ATNDSINVTFTNRFTTPLEARFIITPTADDGTACVGDAFVILVSVSEPIRVTINSGQNTDVCQGTAKGLEAQAVGGNNPYTFTWEVVDSTGTVSDISLETDGTGDRIVRVTAANGDGTVTVQATAMDADGCVSEPQRILLDVLPTPADQQITGPTEVCPGDQGVVYSVNQVGANTYSWSLPQGGAVLLANGASATVNFSNFPGVTIPLVVTETSPAGCAQNDTLMIDIIGTVADFTFAVNASDPSGLTVDFTDASSGATSYAWDFDGLGTSIAMDTSFTFPTSGTYSVCLDITGSCGTDQFCQDVTVTFVSTMACDTIPLIPGLNLISFDITPTDVSANTVFGQLGSNVRNVQGRRNDIPVRWRPGFPLNSLMNVVDGAGYYIDMNAVDTIFVCGMTIDPAYRRPLVNGTNLVAYIPQAPATVTDHFADEIASADPQLGDLQQIRSISENGIPQRWRPGFPLNSLMTVRNGLGYEISFNAPTSPRPPVRDQRSTVNYDFLDVKTNLPAELLGEEVSLYTVDGAFITTLRVETQGLLTPTPIFGQDDISEGGLPEGTRFVLEYLGQRVPLDFTLTGTKAIHDETAFFDVDGLGTSIESVETQDRR